MLKEFFSTWRSYSYDSNRISALYHMINNRFFIRSYQMDSGFFRWCYHDKPEVLEEAMFRLIVNFVEKEHPFEWTDYSEGEWKKSGEMVKATYDFYKKRLPKLRKLQDKCLNIYSDWPLDRELTDRENRRAKLHTKLEDIEEKEITHHLTEIVKYRGFLWT